MIRGANIDHFIGDHWRGFDGAASHVAPQLAACPGINGMQSTVMRTNVDDPIGNCGRSNSVILSEAKDLGWIGAGLVAPQLLASTGIECIEQMVLRTDKDHSIGNHRRRADSVPGGIAPYPGTCASIKCISFVVP